ncbi:hypothetical protein HW115_11590 [Verrucomicrobiaceae bacterium N1E253]|uniref:Uncharacterized protein n=1 Tax=Oceaniferula marina TaxID=2748318 RepID=A0A851GFT0_9BACT|nr:hypothetical protein [Oceaniferula marina]NWK56256.1 hypothetical protein [Oceaniferula marina]
MRLSSTRLLTLASAAALPLSLHAEDHPQISGVFPHLAHTNEEREVGIGAVVPWAGSLWTNTYGPHLPHGSTDKLRQIDMNWNVIERPESVGGTPANRMIHPETKQLCIGHHVIDQHGRVRTIDPKHTMPGRITANARHLSDPKNKIYYITMEDGVYEVDLHSLEVNDIVRDPINISKTHLPGYHSKGAYTGSGRMVMSNNGEPNNTAPSGCLASWDGKDWTVVARNQFTEVTGPGGISGNNPDDDRVWSVGWDAKSLRLFLLEDGTWHTFRLPKGSYTHDSNHGWNTEWPRIRKVKEDLTLMHMHGLFFDFPQTFSASNYGGIHPICTYVKMPVDYAWFNGKLVMGKDDASMFDNAFVKQSQSNLWVGDLKDLESWGPKSGFGGVWLRENFDLGETSEPFFIGGFKHATLHLQHQGGFEFPVEIQVDRKGNGKWESYRTVTTDKTNGYTYHILSDLDAQWVRLVAKGAAHHITAYFQLSSPYPEIKDQKLFSALAAITTPAPEGALLQLPKGREMKLNAFTKSGLIQVDGQLKAAPKKNTTSDAKTARAIAIKNDTRVGADKASAFVQFKDADGRDMTLRLPRGHDSFDATLGKTRHIREIVTERTTMNLHGTFYELPRPKPGKFLNFWQMKPIASHSKHIHDFCSWRGMLVLSGAKTGSTSPRHIALNASSSLWLGEIDDLWKLGKPTGQGGPWLNTSVEAGQASDPYLMLGYEHKKLNLSHNSHKPVSFDIEVDFLGTGEFAHYATLVVPSGKNISHLFPSGFAAHWARITSKANTTASAQFNYASSTPHPPEQPSRP